MSLSHLREGVDILSLRHLGRLERVRDGFPYQLHLVLYQLSLYISGCQNETLTGKRIDFKSPTRTAFDSKRTVNKYFKSRPSYKYSFYNKEVQLWANLSQVTNILSIIRKYNFGQKLRALQERHLLLNQMKKGLVNNVNGLVTTSMSSKSTKKLVFKKYFRIAQSYTFLFL